jgi:Alpha/beta hydrolase of unknown function (DUF900)
MTIILDPYSVMVAMSSQPKSICCRAFSRLLLFACMALSLSGCITGIKYGDVPHAVLAADERCDPDGAKSAVWANKPIFGVTSRLPDCRTLPLKLTDFRTDDLRYLRFGEAPILKGKAQAIPFAFASEKDWWAQLETATKASNGQVLLYVHGFRERFETSAKDTLQIARMSENTAPVIHYSWPSQGELLSYGVDETNMYFDEDNFALFLQALAERPWVKDIRIVAHSMGARLVLPAIEYVDSKSTIRDSTNISNIILAAPDMDRQAFERDVGEGILTPARVKAGRHMTLYVSAKDGAIGLSRTLHGYPRLGAPFCFNPFEMAALKAKGLPLRCYPANFKNAESIATALTIIDTTDVSIGRSGHANHIRSAIACRDFAAVLKGAQGTDRVATYLPYVFTLRPAGKGIELDNRVECSQGS